MLIAAERTIPFLHEALAALGEEVYFFSADEFAAGKVKQADVLVVRSINKCTRAVLAGSRTRLIAAASTGFDHIDTSYCAQAGIAWQNAPGSNARSVAEYVLACLSALSLRSGEALSGKTVGIVGVGHVGGILEQLCTAIGMRVLRNDPPRAEKEGSAGFVSLDTVAAEADVITFHTPLTRTGHHPTVHLADSRFIGKLRRRPCLVNAARGSVCDTAALLSGKERGSVSALVIDCWENEPAISGELLAAADIATPHIAGFSADGKANAARRCVETVGRFLRLPEAKLSEAFRHVVLPPADRPSIDLSTFPDRRIERAVLASFDPLPIDAALRRSPSSFETFRSRYAHPREFCARSVVKATAEEAVTLHRLGFLCTFAAPT